MKITLLALTLLLSQAMLSQSALLPDQASLDLPKSYILYLPAQGINLYDAPGGTHVGRLSYEREGVKTPRMEGDPPPKVARLAVLSPRDNRPVTLPLTAFLRSENHCYYVPVVQVEGGFARLFGSTEPSTYWASIKELEQQGFGVGKAPENAGQPMGAAGVLVPDFGRYPDLPRQNYAYAPKKPLPLYPDAEGARFASLSRFCPVGRFSDGHMRMFVLPDSNPNQCIHVELTDLHHWSDDAYMLRYARYQEGRVCLFSIQGVDYWCAVSDLCQEGFVFLSWADYLVQRREELPAHASGTIRLRSAPYADATVKHEFEGDFHDIFLIAYDDDLYFEGDWCKVRIQRYKADPCTLPQSSPDNLLEVVEGWMRLLDEDGQPLVFLNTKGC